MKLSTQEDIEAPQDEVYQAVTDFDQFEKQLRQKGVDVIRKSSKIPNVPELSWKASFVWRDRSHQVDAELVSVDPGQGYAIEGIGSGIKCMTVVDLLALSDQRTRLFVSLDARATTFGSRVLLHSIRLVKGSISNRFRTRVADFAAGIPGRSSR